VINSRFARQVLAFGDKGQAKLGEAHAAVVGVGGIGSSVLQALAYLGVGGFTLIDADHVEESNLNRLIGATQRDIGHAKVDVVAARLLEVNPTIRLERISADLRTRRALTALREASVVFGCVDNDGARLILTEFCAAYRKLYVDSATEIIPSRDRVPFEFGGRVVVSSPGDFCLSCAGELDMEAAKADLEPADVKRLRHAHGYGIAEATAPAVVSLNGIMANIASTEFMVAVTGVRLPIVKSTYRGMRGVVLVSTDRAKPGCINCEYWLGKGDSADLMRYALD
jgi:molybdopterin-synthase adenylyltransferase